MLLSSTSIASAYWGGEARVELPLERNETDVYEWLTIGTFTAANVIIGAIFIGRRGCW